MTPVAMVPTGFPADYGAAVTAALEASAAAATLSSHELVILKPNVVNSSPPPVTTDWRFTAAVAGYLSSRIDGRIIIAEGSGEGSSVENMGRLGYENIGLPLVDLDAEPLLRLAHPLAGTFREVLLPRCLTEGALVSLPSAKQHTITGVTLGLKNLVGCLPAKHYGGYWSYKKSRIHQLGEDGAIADLILYIEPAFTVIDASLGLVGGHLAGSVPDPPVGRVVAGADVIAVDTAAARLLRAGKPVGHLEAAAALRRKARSAGMHYNVSAMPGGGEPAQGGQHETRNAG